MLHRYIYINNIILFSLRWERNKDFQRSDTLFSNSSCVLGAPFTNSQRAQSLENYKN